MTVPADHPPALNVENPWPGLAAYDEASSGFFYGRRDEAAELLRLVRLAPLTVVYGKSGLGKTSLLQAGLFPLLRAAHYLPVHLRLDFSETVKEPPLQQVMRRLLEEFDRVKAEHSEPESGEDLWKYLHRRDFEAWSADNFPLTPVLVFDQFEELFSRSGGKVELIAQVFDGLADLIENRIPADIARALDGAQRSRLDLLSQRYRVMLSFREDFLPEVRTWEAKVPSLLRNYLRLDPLSRARAVEAVECAGKAVLGEGVASVIVDFVGRLDERVDATEASAMVIEPVLLSLCCYQLNRRRAPGLPIDRALVLAAGQDILNSFYRDALDDREVTGLPDVALFIEDYLIQGDHYRGDYPVKEALDEQRLTGAQLAALTDRLRLLRIVHHSDTSRVELIHDRLVPVVRTARDERRIKRHQEEQERLALEAQAERDKERKRSDELKQQRDAVTESLRVASRSRNIAAVLAVVSLIVIAWGWRQRLAKDQLEVQLKLRAAVGVDTARLAEGRLALGVGMEPLEQTMYRGLAAYRLSVSDQGLSQARAASLTALHFVLEASGRLRKAVTIRGFVPTAAMVYSPDGRTLAVGGEDGLIRLLDADTYRETGDRLDCRQSSPEPVWTLAFNRDGTRLAAGYAVGDVRAPGQGLVCVFDVPRRSVVRSWSTKALNGRSSAVYGLAYSTKPGTDVVIAGGSDNVLRLFDVAAGNVRELPHEGAVTTVSVSPDGLLVASGSYDAIIRVWTMAELTGSNVQPLKLIGHGATVNQVSFSPADPSVLVSASDDGRIIVWGMTADGARQQGCRAQQSKLQSARVYGFAVSPDGEMIAAAGADGNVRLFRLLKPAAPCSSPKRSGAEPPEFDVVADGVLSGHGGIVLTAAYTPDGNHLASTGQDGSIRIWNPKIGGFSLAEFQLDSVVSALAISPDGKVIAAGDEEGTIHLWDRPKENIEGVMPSPVANWRAHDKAIRSLVYIQNAGRPVLISGGDDGVVRRWDPVSRTSLGPDMGAAAERVRSIAVSPDGKTLAVGSSDGAIRLWDAATGQRGREFGKPKDAEEGYELYAVGFSADGKHLAVGGLDRRLRVLDIEPPGTEHTLQGHADIIKSLSRGGARWLLSAGRDGSVLEWQQAALEPSQTESLKKHDQFKFRLGFRDLRPLTSMDTSADGGLILTGGDNGQVQLWDGVEHVLVGARFPGHQTDTAIRAVAVASDGSFFATADRSKILVWPGPERWADIICSKLVWNMSDAQWRDWVSPAIPYMAQCQGLTVATDDGAAATTK